MSAFYTMDNLNRVVTADQGKLVESSANYSIDDDWRWRKETWTLSQTGNWLAHNIGTNSAANNALVETGTFNTANEWTGRSRTVPGTASDTLVYDKVGNLVNDGKGLAYKYDGLGRLREVRLTGESNRLKTAYRYNGLGMRITHAINMSAGTSDDDVTDSGDPVTYFAYDERWRIAGAWVSDANTTPSSSTPTERWIHHAAGIGGRGGSSYIDSVVLRDRDVVTSGGSASSTSDGGSDALEERIYVLQNWRADVVATVGRTGTLIEWMQYTAYGSAITNPPGNADFNGDGIVDESDTEAFFDAFTAGLLSADVNNDGSVTGDDIEAFEDIWDTGLYPEAGLCVRTAIRVGYAGYQWDGSVNIASERAYTGAMAGLYHVRFRVYDPEMGRWTRRDPIGYVDGMSVYEYARSAPAIGVDPSGLVWMLCCSDKINTLCNLGSCPFQPSILYSEAQAWYVEHWVNVWNSETKGACTDACAAGGAAMAWCVNGQPITCVCNGSPSNPSRHGSDFGSQYASCQRQYEDSQWASGIHPYCAPGYTGNPNNQTGAQGSLKQRACDKAAHLQSFAACIRGIQCGQDPKCISLRCQYAVRQKYEGLAHTACCQATNEDTSRCIQRGRQEQFASQGYLSEMAQCQTVVTITPRR